MYCVVYVTTKAMEEGEKIARGLISEHLAACINIVPKVKSIYRWEGNIEEGDEALLIIKTNETLLPLLTKWVLSNHSYSVPEVVALPITGGNEKYLAWIGESVKPSNGMNKVPHQVNGETK